MAGEIIMPVLGMAQDKGLLVAWRKQIGDAVNEDDVLFEVETDKANVEVPAGKTGYISALLADAGNEIPVGETIAIISAEKPDVAAPDAQQASVVKSTIAQPEPCPPVADNPKAADSNPAQSHDRSLERARILASPKAKRMAKDRGLELGRLVTQGVPQPYHVADLENIARPVVSPSAAPSSNAVAAAWCEYEASADKVPSSSLLAWISEKTGQPFEPSALWAGFAAGALNRSSAHIRVENEHGTRNYMVDGRARLSTIVSGDIQGEPDVIIHDLSATRVSTFRSGNGVTAMLSIARGKDAGTMALAMGFDEGHMSRRDALVFFEGFLARMDDPLNHLL